MENETKQQAQPINESHAGSEEKARQPFQPRHARQWQRARPGYHFPRRLRGASIAAGETESVQHPRAVGIKAAVPSLGHEWPGIMDADHSIRGEQAMWRAVILQALTDAACESHKYEARLEREKARRWLLAAGPDFQEVCDLAGFDAGRVKRHARKALAGGCQWRIAPKEGSLAFQRR